MTWFACVEGGGTKFQLARVTADGRLLDRLRLPTEHPDRTLAACVAHFQNLTAQYGPPLAFGIGSFGPLDVSPSSLQFGRLLDTPKPGWRHVDLRAAFATRFAVPIGIDTDVHAAALGEWQQGAGRGQSVLCYLTVGTGIGGGLLIRGQPVHGSLHPELGHLRPRRHPEDLTFPGVCPFHQDCFEGLASGPAIVARWGQPLASLIDSHPAHGIIADYLGQLCAQLVLVVSPERIVMGGGVLEAAGLLSQVKARTHVWLAGYPSNRQGLDTVVWLDRVIQPPVLGDDAALLGAWVLARKAAGIE